MRNKSFLYSLTFSLFLLGTIFLSGFAVYKISSGDVVETNILALLPKDAHSDLTQFAEEKISGNFEKKLVVLLGHPDAHVATNAAKELRSALQPTNLFAASPAAGSNELDSLRNFYQDYNHLLLTEKQAGLLKADDVAAVRQNILAQIYGLGMDVSTLDVSRDPLLFFSDYVSSLIGRSVQNFELVDGVPVVSKDGTSYAVVNLELIQSAFSLNYQDEVIAALDQAQQQITRTYPDLDIVRSGLIFHATHGATVAKQEVGTMGTLSMLGVFLLMMVVFKSPRPILVSMAGIVAGTLLGFALCLVFFDKVHMLTLVFGTSLVGISTDYSLHFFAEKYQQKTWDADKAIKTIFPGITLGLLTSIVGFLGLCLTPLPVLQQMAVFSIAGLVFVYGSIVFIYPSLFRAMPFTANAGIYSIAQSYLKLWDAYHPHKFYRYIFAVIILLMAVIPFLPGKDDLRAMQSLSPELIKNDMKVARLLGTPMSFQYFIISAADDNTLLEKLQSVTQQLDQLKTENLIEDYYALNTYIQPQDQQRRNAALLLNFVQTHEDELTKLFSELNMPADTYARYKAYLSAQKDAAFSVQDLLGVQGSDQLRLLYTDEYPQQKIGFIMLKHPTDVAPLIKIDHPSYGVYFMDKVASVSAILDHYRSITFLTATGGYVVVFLMLLFFYSPYQIARIFAPNLLAALIALILIVMMNGSYSLFHVLALFLVMGIGIDYALFLVESEGQDKEGHTAPTMTAVLLSVITTLLSFGLLATSSTSALHDFGLMILIGITISYILSPMAMIKQEKSIHHDGSI